MARHYETRAPRSRLGGSPQTNWSRFSPSRVKPILFRHDEAKTPSFEIAIWSPFLNPLGSQKSFLCSACTKIFWRNENVPQTDISGILGLEKGWKCPLSMSALNRFCPEVFLYWEMTTLNCQNPKLNERILTARKEAGCEVLATQMWLTLSHQFWKLFRFNRVIPKQRAS